MVKTIEVASFQKNSGEEVRAQLTNYKGYDLIDLRVFAIKQDGEAIATRKGLTLNVDLLPELKKAILALEEALNKAAETNLR